MRKTKFLLLAGTVLPTFALSGPSIAESHRPETPIVLAQQDPDRAQQREQRQQERAQQREDRQQDRAQQREERQQQRQERAGGGNAGGAAAGGDRAQQREERQQERAQQREERQQQRPERAGGDAGGAAAGGDRAQQREERQQERAQQREERQQQRQERAGGGNAGGGAERGGGNAGGADRAQQREERQQQREERQQDRGQKRDDQPNRGGADADRGGAGGGGSLRDRMDRDRQQDRPDDRMERREKREDAQERREDKQERREDAREKREDTRERGEDRQERREDAREKRDDRQDRREDARDNRIDRLKDQRRERRDGNRVFITEPGGRTIIREGNRTIIRRDETARFRINARDVREERRGGEIRTIITRPDGSRIITVTDENGRLLRRIRESGGREYVLIDNRPRGGRDGLFISLDIAPPRITIPRERYIVDADTASADEIYEAFEAEPVARPERSYSLDEIRQSAPLRSYVRSVDLDSITFDTGSWEVRDDQIKKLETVGKGMERAIKKDPNAVFMVEGHTDAVGNDDDNLSLSDRRAESVAEILTKYFDIPAENLTTQGYGEQYLKVETEGAEERNRRVSVRNITPLLSSKN